MSAALKSYVKSTAACLAFAGACAAGAIAGFIFFLPRPGSLLLGVLAALAALAGAILALAGALVMWRHRRATLGKRDLYLELNRSREPAVIESAGVRRWTRTRRQLARRFLDHDFLVGDLVEVRPWAEIRATLDERGCLEELPFMPEMLAMCGRRARVFRGMHRLFDYRKSRRMRHMRGAVLLAGAVCNGANHGGCEAACHTIWKAAWLRRVDSPPCAPIPPANDAILEFGTQPPRFVCQLTQLHAASEPVGDWSVINFWRPLIAGNVAPAAFLVAWLTHLFNELQHHRGGIGFPAFDSGAHDGAQPDEVRFRPGDCVRVRSPAAIRATLNDRLIHRGMGFEPDMLKYCGGRLHVQAEISKLIDIVTGEMRIMKTPAYLLHDVHFSGERQLFNAQYEPLFWRAVWLREASPIPVAADDVN